MIPHYLMIGGFLGAGKTTAVLRAAEYLSGRGHGVGAIMNDQSESLVDTALARARQLPVEEIAGGCFCCRFSSLVEAAARLDDTTRPDIILAEPVGSCTDLNATVALPLRQLYGDRYRVAPLSVLLDPARALRVLGVESGRAFSAKVHYVYAKQLEEADVLVVNKVDAVSSQRVQTLTSALRERYPHARIITISARAGTGVSEWIDGLLDGAHRGRVLDIDYDTYAEGEALLGWLNCAATVAGAVVDGDELLMGIARRIQAALAGEGVEIAHLKLTIEPADGPGIAVVNATRTDARPELAFALDAQLEAGDVTVNLRAEAAPERLEAAVRASLDTEAQATGARISVTHLERFRPGRPVPTHRMTAAAS